MGFTNTAGAALEARSPNGPLVGPRVRGVTEENSVCPARVHAFLEIYDGLREPDSPRETHPIEGGGRAGRSAASDEYPPSPTPPSPKADSPTACPDLGF